MNRQAVRLDNAGDDTAATLKPRTYRAATVSPPTSGLGQACTASYAPDTAAHHAGSSDTPDSPADASDSRAVAARAAMPRRLH